MEFRLQAESLECAAFRLKAELHAEELEQGLIGLLYLKPPVSI